ncbi:MAG: cysteine desulfurase [Flavobacteriaceae bacterium]|nr:cysteine desulfurase [Flavobacteriaceae bacterium]
MPKVYLDNAATTAVRPEVVATMTEVLQNEYGNPSSTHNIGQSSKAILEQCRKDIAKMFNAHPGEIIFTSGGTEADNLVLRAAVRDLNTQVLITSPIEHHAVLHTAEALAQEYDITLELVNIDSQGAVDLTHLESLLDQYQDKKVLVSLMHVNNEIGVILPLKKVANMCKNYGALLHSDTVQSIGHYTMDFSEIPLDFAAVAAHKFHGPKGVGFAFIRKGSGLNPMILGGGQERGMRAGTEPVYAVAGMTKALEYAYNHLEQEAAYVLSLKKRFIDGLTALPGVRLNGGCGDLENSTYTLVNVGLPIDSAQSAMLLFQLDLKGVACSQGSACQSGSSGGSHVLQALDKVGVPMMPSLRFSFSMFNTPEDIDFALESLKSLLAQSV